MSDLLELAMGLHKQAKEAKKSGAAAGTAAGLGTAYAGVKTWEHGAKRLAATKGKKGALAYGLGTGVLYGSIQVGKKVKHAIEKSAAEKAKEKKDPLRPGVVAGLATMAAGVGAHGKGSHEQVRAMKSIASNNTRTQAGDFVAKKTKGYYENGKYVKGATPNLRANRLHAVNAKANKLGVAGMKKSKIGSVAVVASPLVGALVGKAHSMMTKKKDK